MSWKIKRPYQQPEEPDALVPRLHPLVFQVQHELSSKGLLALAQKYYRGADPRQAKSAAICMVTEACLRRASKRALGAEMSPEAEYERTHDQREWVMQKMAAEPLAHVTAALTALLREGVVPTPDTFLTEVVYDSTTNTATSAEGTEAAQFHQRLMQIGNALRICLDLPPEAGK